MKPAVLASSASRWRQFQAYWSLSWFHETLFFGMRSWAFSLRTPLFAFAISENMPQLVVMTVFSGLKLYLLPANWTCKIQDGMSLYRHEWSWGSEITVEKLLYPAPTP